MNFTTASRSFLGSSRNCPTCGTEESAPHLIKLTQKLILKTDDKNLLQKYDRPENPVIPKNEEIFAFLSLIVVSRVFSVRKQAIHTAKEVLVAIIMDKKRLISVWWRDFFGLFAEPKIKNRTFVPNLVLL